MRRPIAQLLRILDGWLPVRRMRMTGAVAAAVAGYAAMLALQLSLVLPVPGEASTAAPVVLGGGLLTISADTGVCLLPVCFLAPRCAAAVGAGCLLPVATPPPAQPAPTAPPAPPAAPPAAPAAALPIPVHPSPAHPVAHPVVARRAAVRAPVAWVAWPRLPAPVTESTRVDRPVLAAPVEPAPPLTSGGALPAAPVATVRPLRVPAPAGSPWALYALFAAVDGAAVVALAVLIRRTASAQRPG